MLGCPPQQPPPAQYQIEIFAGNGLVFQANPGSPPYDWVWGGAALAPVPGIGIKSSGGVGTPGAPITINFLQTTDLDPNNFSQLAVFFRDPNEQRQTFDSAFDPTLWRQEVDLCHLPQVPILTAVPGIGPFASTAIYTSASPEFPFCKGGPQGAAAFPNGLSSVKTIGLSREGLCRTFVGWETQRIFSQLQQTIRDSWGSAAASATTCADAIVHAADLVSYVDYNPGVGPDTLAKSGFFVNVSLQAHIFAPFPDTFVHAQYRYDLLLTTQGRFTVAPHENFAVGSGYQSADGITQLSDSLATTVNQTLHAASDDAQVAAPANEANGATACSSDDECSTGFGCLPSTHVAGRTCQLYIFGACNQTVDPTTGQPSTVLGAGECSTAINQVGANAKKGASLAGLNLQDTNQVVVTTKDVTNWRCKRPTNGVADSTERARCEYILPAKRLNRHPDGFDLVWFDGVEPSNPAYAFYVALLGFQKNLGQPGLTAALCGTPPDQGSVRGFSHTESGSADMSDVVHFAADRNAIGCLGENISNWLIAFGRWFGNWVATPPFLQFKF